MEQLNLEQLQVQNSSWNNYDYYYEGECAEDLDEEFYAQVSQKTCLEQDIYNGTNDIRHQIKVDLNYLKESPKKIKTEIREEFYGQKL